MRLVGVYVWVGTGTVWQRCREVCVSYRSISVWIKYFKMLSVSMMVDRKRSPKPWKILPRLPSAWLDDSRSDVCFDCGSVFGLMLRKHHCRSCGRLFCRFCLKKGLIPFSYSSFVARYSKDLGMDVSSLFDAYVCRMENRRFDDGLGVFAGHMV